MSLLHLIINTPGEILVDDNSVCSVRARDRTGSFGILPGHTNLITALSDSVIRWREPSEDTRYCAIRGGVLLLGERNVVRIACREGLLGDDLALLQSAVQVHRVTETDAEREEITRQVRLHTQAIRRLTSYLRAAPRSTGRSPE